MVVRNGFSRGNPLRRWLGWIFLWFQKRKFGRNFLGFLAIKGLEDGLGGGERNAGEGGELGGCGLANFGDGLEVLEESGFAAWGDAGAVVEEAFAHAALEEEGVVGIGEAVGFVADALEELEGALVVGDEEGEWVAGEEDFFALFGEADEGELGEADGFELGEGGAELSFAAVDDDEVGEVDGGEIFAGEAALGVDGGFLGVLGDFGIFLGIFA